MARAYILVRTEVGRAAEVQAALRALAGVRDADVVTGEYDLVVVAETQSAQDLGRLVMREIHGLPGVTITTTFVVVG